PAAALRALLLRIPPRDIPWDFIDLIETDPARRVRLKISHERLGKLHPADIVEEMEPDAAADLLGDLSDERSEEILVQMQPEERQEVADLLEFKENTA